MRLADFCRVMMLALVCGISCPATAAETGSEVAVSRWVIDSACAGTRGLDKPIGVACAKACAKNGSPLVILRDDGTIFDCRPDDKTPASSQNPRLLPFAGERVTVVGKDYVRNRSHGTERASG